MITLRSRTHILQLHEKPYVRRHQQVSLSMLLTSTVLAAQFTQCLDLPAPATHAFAGTPCTVNIQSL
jgi:hypothetical protein